MQPPNITSTSNISGVTKRVIPRFGEFCHHCYLPLLPQLDCNILASWEWFIFRPLLRPECQNISILSILWSHAANWLKLTLPSQRNLTSATRRLSEKATNFAATAIGPSRVIIPILSVPYNVHIFHLSLNLAMWVEARDPGWSKGWGDFITANCNGFGFMILQRY